MLLLKTSVPWLLLAFLGQQVSQSSGGRTKNRGADKSVTPAPGRAQGGGGNKPAASGRGKFSIKDKMQCMWEAKNVGDTVGLSVKCEARIKGEASDVQCKYNAKPQSCPEYQTDTKGFWKQVARAFKRLQGKVCNDDRALVRAGMCKRAPRDAHFKLDRSSVAFSQSGEPETPQPPPSLSISTAAAPSGPTACSRRADHRKTAEENCSGWASVCNFFLTMLQSNEC
ncbi:fibroblast growth factor-binding protein 1 [Etheostoma spectabile]|uniref:fibroblast growth factor-binding protein 1 n=1 Tax=Etheostoma spectabile TaxID=54343 RepID=UPI0013AFE23E|nr:fibroblast growth factor-binding protein 1-like [Etheostoma spectabile]XP_032393970.1 fibroblast growth factor-binding protein 1-like [Etheostoma spectabile]